METTNKMLNYALSQKIPGRVWLYGNGEQHIEYLSNLTDANDDYIVFSISDNPHKKIQRIYPEKSIIKVELEG